MKDAVQPPLVIIGGVVNSLAGMLNLLVGLAYLFLCYGIIVIPVGIWQIVVGGLACTGKRVPTHIAAAITGACMSVITFNILGLLMCGVAAALLLVEFSMKPQNA